MCFSATVSYSAAAVLVPTGLYAVQQARRSLTPYWTWGLIPVFFGLQQAFEGRVWQELDAGNVQAAVPFALGFHFFSHFLWLWWLGLSSYVVEPGNIRRLVIGGCTVFGAFAGTLVFSVMLSHPEWMNIAIREHSIVYKFSVPYRDSIHLPITPAALYALTTLVPLLLSSHRLINIFGLLVALSSVLASTIYGYAYVSVWCFFAALISLYLVYMVRSLVAKSKPVTV
ncbi:DUF6629 family protein [Sideroxydans sp. CL21]|uniref:DUF6629 family protein n=1 Tax=Sideroxydans sp. CL21 TaxID=2600596 RepID=UPI0024BC1A1E|nr:DUF6629 family protein [Sideroxydans sp. CL21]